MEKDNVQIFIELYNVLDDLLRERYHEQSRSISMINRYINSLEKSSNLELNKKSRKLNMIRILRNNLVHEFDFNCENILAISDDTISFLKQEIYYLKNPITAYKISTKLDSLYCCHCQDKLKDVLKTMSSRGFTQIPVLENKKLYGVFSPNAMFAYLARNGLNKNHDLTIGDLSNYLPCNNHISEKYEFIERNAYLEDVLELFDNSNRSNKKLVAIFVTEHGLTEEDILGMIVPIDILRTF